MNFKQFRSIVVEFGPHVEEHSEEAMLAKIKGEPSKFDYELFCVWFGYNNVVEFVGYDAKWSKEQIDNIVKWDEELQDFIIKEHMIEWYKQKFFSEMVVCQTKQIPSNKAKLIAWENVK